MAFRLTWHTQAAEDLDAIYEYIAQDEPQQAAKVARQVYQAVHSIPENPWLGRLIPELDRHDCRERIHGRYRIAYLVKAEEIIILTIWHSARRLPEILARLQG